MSIRFDCTECGKSLKVRDEKAGWQDAMPVGATSCCKSPTLMKTRNGKRRKIPTNDRHRPNRKGRSRSAPTEIHPARLQPRRKSDRKRVANRQTVSVASRSGLLLLLGCSFLGLLSLGVGGMLGLKYGNYNPGPIVQASNQAVGEQDTVKEVPGKKVAGGSGVPEKSRWQEGTAIRCHRSHSTGRQI